MPGGWKNHFNPEKEYTFKKNNSLKYIHFNTTLPQEMRNNLCAYFCVMCNLSPDFYKGAENRVHIQYENAPNTSK